MKHLLHAGRAALTLFIDLTESTSSRPFASLHQPRELIRHLRLVVVFRPERKTLGLYLPNLRLIDHLRHSPHVRFLGDGEPVKDKGTSINLSGSKG